MISRVARFGISGLLLVLDRLTKYWIETKLDSWDTIVVIPGVFNIIHAQNRGAAFGVMNQSEGPLRTFLLVGVSFAVMVFVAVQLWRIPKGSWPPGNVAPVALAVVLGGAAGNLYDRILRGSVTDFLQFFIGSFEWPSFNVADSAITIGAGLLMFSLWTTSRTAS
jgi:signal peptidase II